MKILQINNCHFRRGGADIAYFNTIELLNENKHSVICFSTQNKQNIVNPELSYSIKAPDFFNTSLIKKILLFPRFLYSISAYKQISKLIKQEKPDIAHIHLYKGGLTPSILVALRKHKIPIVITLHDFGLLCPHNLFLNGKNKLCTKCTNSSSINCIINKCNRNNLILSVVSFLEFNFHNYFIKPNLYFDRLIVVSKFGYGVHSLDKYFKLKIKHLYNFFPNLTTCTPNNDKGLYFLYYGRLSSEKGISTLLSSWFKLDKKIKLKIVGTGPLYNYCYKNISCNIEVLGYKSGDELYQIVSESSFVILPSECYENNPLTIIEAYSYGKPVIASNIGGIPEIVNENTGFLFDYGNSNSLVEAIYKANNINQGEYKKISNNCRLFAEEHFNKEMHYKNLIDTYNETIKTK